MSTIRGGNITKNSYILFKNVPHRVLKADFMSPGKGSAYMRCKLKNVLNGLQFEFTFKSNESVEEADVEKKEMQFLYSDETEVVFMDPRSFEQVNVPADLLEDRVKLLTADSLVHILFYQDKGIGVVMPPNVVLKVTEAQDAVAGNRVNAPKKPVILETGLEIMAPLFIKAGDKVSVDTDTLNYLQRVN